MTAYPSSTSARPGLARARRRPFSEPPARAQQHVVRMTDGTLLATDVYMPKGRRGSVLLCRLPYDKAGSECFMPDIATWFNERGYVVVVQDVRGKLRSGGKATPFEHEGRDGFETLAWITRQSWSLGAVGMFGDSYMGFSQWAVAALGHPALGAITPRVTLADFRSLFYRQGVFALETAMTWALETWVDEALYDYADGLDWTARPLSDIAPRALGGIRPSGLDAWAMGRLPPSATVPARGSVPALHLGGLDDLMLRGQLDAWRRSRRGPTSQYLILDARDHAWTLRRSEGTVYEDPQSSTGAMQRFLDDYLQPLADFFDRELRSRGKYDFAPVRWRTHQGTFHEDKLWPPEGLLETTRFLTGGGNLSPSPGRVTKILEWSHDPCDPIPTLAHVYYPLVEPADERSTLEREDALVFATEPARRSELLIGPAELETSFSSSAPSAHVIATLYDLSPQGSVRRIADGAAMARGPWPASVTIDLGDLGYELPAGHALAICIAGSSFPRYLVHPGNGNDPWTTTDFDTPSHSIAVGGDTGSRLLYYGCAKDHT